MNIQHIHISNPYTCIPDSTRICAYVITHSYDNVHAEKYIGSTNNFNRRFYQHYDKKILYIDLFVADNIKLAHNIEKLLIKLIKPLTNRNDLPLDQDDKILIQEILENDIIKKYLLLNTIKIGERYLKYMKHTDSYFGHVNNYIRKTNMVATLINLPDIYDRQIQILKVKKGVKSKHEIIENIIIDYIDNQKEE